VMFVMVSKYLSMEERHELGTFQQMKFQLKRP
jgi:hypothetical protein